VQASLHCQDIIVWLEFELAQMSDAFPRPESFRFEAGKSSKLYAIRTVANPIEGCPRHRQESPRRGPLVAKRTGGFE
jgi:hypothetical protein